MGNYDDHRFQGEAQSVLEYGGYSYAPQVMKDEKGGHILFTWLWEGRSEEAQRAGWAGVMSLPRILSVDDRKRVCMRPAPELWALRGRHVAFHELNVDEDAPHFLKEVAGDALEIAGEFTPASATRFGLAFRRSPDGEEETRLLYDAGRETLWIDRRRASLDPQTHSEVPDSHRQVARMPVTLQEGKLRLHIFLDCSVVEVYANEEAVLSTRIYPTRPDSQGLRLFSEGGALRVNYLDVWELSAIWPGMAH